MIDPPLILCAAAYLVLGLVYGWIVVEFTSNKSPWDWRGQWWPFAVVGIMSVFLTVYFIWNWARPDMVLSSKSMIDMVLIDTVILFVAALPGIAGWQVADAVGQIRDETKDKPGAVAFDYDTVVNDAVERLSGYIANNMYKDTITTNGKEPAIRKRETA